MPPRYNICLNQPGKLHNRGARLGNECSRAVVIVDFHEAIRVGPEAMGTLLSPIIDSTVMISQRFYS